jgi:outer membrane protein
MKKILVSIIIGASTLCSVSAQQQWSLEQCIEYAWKKNLTIKTNELSTQSQEIRLQQAKNRRLPNLNASLSSPLNYGLSQTANGLKEGGREFTTSVSGDISSSITVFNGFQISNNIKAQAFSLQATIEDLKKAKESVAVNIASAYLQVLYNKELYTIALNQVKLSEELLNRSESLASYGKIPEGQVYEAKAQLAKDKQSATESQNTLKLSLLDLSQLLELKEWNNFDVAQPSIDILPANLIIPNAEEVYTYASQNKPDVKASDFRMKSSEKSLEVAKGAYYPTVSLSASYGNGYYPSSRTYDLEGNSSRIPLSTQLKNNYSAGFYLSMSIPIFTRFENKNNVRLSNIELENTKINLENSKKTLYKEIQQAWFNATSAQEKYNATADVLTNTEEAFRFAEEKYNNGKATIYEYNQAKINLASAKSNQLQAKYNLLFCVKILDFYKGDALKL